jgi:LmbE family N-acetylglucosaminyl deacetylase/CheY-like chemotaxis protein
MSRILGLDDNDSTARLPKMDFIDQETRILLVTGDREYALATQPLLAELGQVTWVEDADHALQLLLTGDWNIVIVQLDAPGMEGLELLRATRSLDPAPLGLVVGDEGRFDHAIAAIRAGASNYVAKSEASDELLREVHKAIELERTIRSKHLPSERVLAIGAHPDDVEIGCGGILLRHRDAGHSITILTLTSGAAGGAPTVRSTESHRAAGLLSARLFLLDLDDTAVSEGGSTISAISAVIEQVRPTTIYTHTDSDSHQDHRAAYRATMVGARGIPRVYTYQSPSTTVEFRPTRFASIDQVLERKLALIEPHETQTQVRDYLAPDLLRATARYWGRFGSSDHAEPFEVIRQADIVGTAISPVANTVARELDQQAGAGLTPKLEQRAYAIR